MQDGGAQPNESDSIDRQIAEKMKASQASVDLRNAEEQRRGVSPEERARSEQLFREQQRSQTKRLQAKMEAPLPNTPTGSGSKERPVEGAEQDQGSGLGAAERLLRNQAQAGIAGSTGSGSMSGSLDPREEIQTQIDKANHYLLVEILPNVFAFDCTTFGLLSFATLPIVYWPIAAIWGVEVYNDFTGNSTPLTPRLSWKSFMPPGTEMDIPLPNQPLWIAWIAYVILLVILTIIWLFLGFLIIYSIAEPLAAVSKFANFLPFFSFPTGI